MRVVSRLYSLRRPCVDNGWGGEEKIAYGVYGFAEMEVDEESER